MESISSGSIPSGRKPASPRMTALSVACPSPVHASDPSRSHPPRANATPFHPAAKIAAALIGPPVCDEDGPLPTLNKSPNPILDCCAPPHDANPPQHRITNREHRNTPAQDRQRKYP